MEVKQDINILHTIQHNSCSFGQSLRLIRCTQGISLRKVAKAVNKTPTYISDIERGNNRPPELPLLKEILRELLKMLSPDQAPGDIQDYLYDLAAKERGEVSGDIIEYIMAQTELRKLIRLAQEKEDVGALWQECINRLQ